MEEMTLVSYVKIVAMIAFPNWALGLIVRSKWTDRQTQVVHLSVNHIGIDKQP